MSANCFFGNGVIGWYRHSASYSYYDLEGDIYLGRHTQLDAFLEYNHMFLYPVVSIMSE
jgi:hypothetical protein